MAAMLSTARSCGGLLALVVWRLATHEVAHCCSVRTSWCRHNWLLRCRLSYTTNRSNRGKICWTYQNAPTISIERFRKTAHALSRLQLRWHDRSLLLQAIRLLGGLMGLNRRRRNHLSRRPILMVLLLLLFSAWAYRFGFLLRMAHIYNLILLLGLHHLIIVRVSSAANLLGGSVRAHIVILWRNQSLCGCLLLVFGGIAACAP